MAIIDTLTGTVEGKLRVGLARTTTNFNGEDIISFRKVLNLTDGASANQAVGGFSASFTATTGGITISLADSADPLGAAGDDIPTSDPEGLKLRAIMITNEDSTNYVDVAKGTNALTSWLGGTTPTVRIPAGGMLLATFPSGLDAMNDGTDDEIKVTANSASCTVKIAYIFG